jgi:hypothetical protein
MIFARIQAAQGIVHKILQGIFDPAGIPKDLDSGIRELLLRAHPHASGNDMRDLISQDFVYRDTPAAAMHRRIRHNTGPCNYLFALINIREQKIPALPEMRANMTISPILILQNDADSHMNGLLP